MRRAYSFSTSMLTRTRPGVTYAVCLIPSSLALLGSLLRRYKHTSTVECVLCASSITLRLLWTPYSTNYAVFLSLPSRLPSAVPAAPRPEPHTHTHTLTQHYRLCVLYIVLHKAEGRLQIVICVYIEDWGKAKCYDVGRGYGMRGTGGVFFERHVCVWMFVLMCICM